MPKTKTEGLLRVRLEGMSELVKIPGGLEDAQRDFVRRSGERLRDSIAERAPGGPAGSVGRSFKTFTAGFTRAIIYSDHPGAKALEKGAYIKPRRKGGALRFRDGTFTRRPVRIPAKKYAERGLRSRSKIVKEEFRKTFGDVTS